MKTFTEKEVETLIKATITACTEAHMEWLMDQTEIVDKTTRAKIPNAELDVLKDVDGNIISKSLMGMVYSRLTKHGVNFTPAQTL